MSTGRQFVSRGGEKLEAALDGFCVDVGGLICADFGGNVGGFTDCLLQRGGSKVYAIDTGYGQLAWTLRTDERVVVMERTNALYTPAVEPVDLVVIDVGWTPQELIVPAAMQWAKSPGGKIISLLKPHYELTKSQGSRPFRTLTSDQSNAICLGVCERVGELGCAVRAVMRSPLLGKGGNVEFLLLIQT